MLVYLVTPLTAQMPYEALPPNWQGWVAYLLIGYWFSQLARRVCVIFFFMVISVLIYVICLHPIIKSDLRSDEPLRFEEVQNLSLAYRSVEVWHQYFLENCGYLLIPMQFLVGQFALVVNYSLITQWGDMHSSSKGCLIFVSVMVQAWWLGFVSFGAWFSNNSIKILKSWKQLPGNSKAEIKYMGKFKKSCRSTVPPLHCTLDSLGC